MSAVLWSDPLGVALVGGLFSLILWVGNCVYSGAKNRKDRQREMFSNAFAACVAYQEFPYIVRRRRCDQLESERIRISSELSAVQRELAYYTALLSVESKQVFTAYWGLLSSLRDIAGKQIHEAWLVEPAQSDSAMNMPDLGLQALEPAKATYLRAVGDALSPLPAWLLRLDRKIRNRA